MCCVGQRRVTFISEYAGKHMFEKIGVPRNIFQDAATSPFLCNKIYKVPLLCLDAIKFKIQIMFSYLWSICH